MRAYINKTPAKCTENQLLVICLRITILIPKALELVGTDKIHAHHHIKLSMCSRCDGRCLIADHVRRWRIIQLRFISDTENGTQQHFVNCYSHFSGMVRGLSVPF